MPLGRRPHPAPDRDRSWIRDEKTFQKVFAALPEPVNYVFWLGNRSGLRPSETRALRMQDFAIVDEGLIVVRGSAADDGIGPLKEDWRGHGKAKMVPAHADTEKVIGPWLKRRRAEGAGPEDLVFVPAKPGDRPRACGWQGIRKEFVQSCWEAARIVCGLQDMTFYEATRHSFISRNLEAGVPLDEVSAAVNHSSPLVTKETHYPRFVRRFFSDLIRGVRRLGRTERVRRRGRGAGGRRG